MAEKKKVKVLFFPMVAAVFLSAAQGEAVTGSFLNPADNAYSLKKVFSRPFLQSSPIPRIWQTDSKSEKFRQVEKDLMTPPSTAERQMKALSSQLEAADDRYVFQRISAEGLSEDWAGFGEMINGLVPVIERAKYNVTFDCDRDDDAYTRRLAEASVSEKEQLTKEMIEFEAFLKTLDKTVPTDVALSALEEYFAQKEDETNRLFASVDQTMLPDDVLEKAQDIYAPETRQIQGLGEIDDLFSSLLVSDALDLGTGYTMLVYDDILTKIPVENKNRSVSLLDRKEKTEQIRSEDPALRRKAFFERLQKYLTGKGI